MTEKIELGENPFGSFVGADAARPTEESKDDPLPELMKLGNAPSFRDSPSELPVGSSAPPVLAPEPTPAREAAPSLATDDELERKELELVAREALRNQATAAARDAETATVEPVLAGETAATTARPPEPLDQRKLWLLRILLASNLAMMLVMLLLPHPMETRTEYVPAGPASSVDDGVPRVVRSSSPPGHPPSAPQSPRTASEPFTTPARPTTLGMPNDPQYERALLQALDGDFAGASTTLREFLAAHPSLDPSLERLVHAHLAYYLRKAGEITGAIEHEAKARQMAGRAFLPEELLRTAREAELRGDGDGMRRAYAQFLLQEDQLPPALKALLQEAYLKLGDAYRVDAERAERALREVPSQPGESGGGRR